MRRLQLLVVLFPLALAVGCDRRRVVCTQDVQCSAGETLCADGVLRACAVDTNGCSSWAAPTTCATGVCADGARCETCVDTCAAGESSCASGVRTVCATAASGCRAPVVMPCASGFCAGTSCGACTDACPSAGATTCAGGQLQTCVADPNGCLAWQASACTSGFCASETTCGTCNHACDAGTTECTNGQLRTCQADTNGCRAWSAPTACSGGFCGTTTSCGACTHGCPTAGATECTNGQLRTCQADANGCRAWSAPTACSGGFCGTATTCGTCSHGCPTSGATECTNGQLRTCQADANGCRAWSAPTSCGSGFCGSASTCGTCTHGCPTSGATECTGGQLRTCQQDGNGCRAWSTASACPSGFCGTTTSCGTCSHGCPSVGATECTSGALRTCQADANGCRAWSAPSSCASGFCSNSTSCGTCAHGCPSVGATECTNGQLRTCAADTNGCRAWSPATACGSGFCGSAQACGACSNTCSTSGATECASGALRTCTADVNGCLAWSTPAACAGTALCRSASQCDRAPLASLTCSASVVQGTQATLDASGSSDPDGDPLSFRYTLPDGGAFDGGATAQVVLTAVGTSALSVRVSDPAGASATASCSVQVTCAAETDEAFCTRASKNCGLLSGTDNCGAPRTASCGACTLPEVCGALSANVCGTPDPALVPAPRPVKPMSLSTVARARPTFHWVLPAGADGAQVEICPNRACATPTLTFAATGTSATPPSDLGGRVIFWRLRGRSGTTLGTATSPVWQFTRRAGTGADTSFGQVPDFDNDGYADAVISAYQEPKTWFYRGSASGLGNVATLASGFTEVDSAGDFNGDGFGDVVLGRNLYLGSAAGIVTSAAQSATSASSLHRVAGVGDVDGDGYSDLGVTSLSASTVRLDLVLGRASGAPTTAQTLSLGTGSTWFVGAAGDVNGDGYADVVVTNCNRNLLFSCAGDAFLYLGSATGLVTTAAWSRLGVEEMSVSSPGDFNADGYADLAVSDWSNVWIYLGSATGFSDTPHRTLARPNTSGYWGQAVELADITGDGLDDLVVGDPQSEVVKPYAAPSLTGLTQVAEAVSDDFDFGSVMATAGDVNGDGRVDVLVGAPNAPMAGTQERAWLFFGNVAGFDRTNGTSQVFFGTTRNKKFGYALR